MDVSTVAEFRPLSLIGYAHPWITNDDDDVRINRYTNVLCR